ncbi:TauD/TfdA family dioxygenase [Litorimonas cladophorae]|uniref:TauD/TfdA family dioxygenase n=1 Tax=Litorimonas cladophorae TaxID=1220491 RepID=UPI0016795A0B|nr:TauD/TfdA family dioxygenase [Litorimonas cladophorae]
MKVEVTHTIGQPVAQVTFETPLPLPETFTSPQGLQLNRPSLIQAAKRIRDTVQGFSDAQYLMDLLTKDSLSALHIQNVFTKDHNLICPQSMVDKNEGAGWHQVSSLVAYLIEAFDLFNISYGCENDGELFIHLFPKEGGDDDAKKSRKNLRGHTDGSVLPLTGQENLEDLPPGPDLIILIGMQNEKSVPTRVHPLSRIIRALKPDSIRMLQENDFVFEPQSTFNLPNLVVMGQPVITESDDGFLIRYSHSKVTYKGNQPATKDALIDLQECIRTTAHDVVLKPGDILFINNRTSIHGRAQVSEEDASAVRWLMRTYCQRDDAKRYKTNLKRPYALDARH